MPGNTIGSALKVTTWGESHGKGVGVVIDGLPPGILLDDAIIQTMMDRRRPGRSKAGTTRKEPDQAVIMSGVFEGQTTGTPVFIMVHNKDADSSAYEPYKDLYRPGHGDITYQAKYGIRDWRGGGRASARETAARVAAGAAAGAFLSQHNIRVTALTIQLGNIKAETIDPDRAETDPYLCPDRDASLQMERLVSETRKKGDSLGGVVDIRANGVPPGLGDPVFDKLDADLAKALMSIGAVKGVEIGAGFSASGLLGSENNDPIIPDGFETNNAGGILAGISTGDELVMRVAVKPIPSITRTQNTIDTSNSPATISTKGRHDISAIPRINVVCEAMVNIVLSDHMLRQRAIS